MQHILLVEDDPEITRLINLHLDSSQYTLTSCTSGKEAKQYLKNENYNLVMLDIGLPDSNGLEICKELRSTDTKTPLLMLTCHGEESDKVLALELGADDYVTKPFGVLELMARIKAIMRRTNNNLYDVVLKEVSHLDLLIDPVKRKASLHGNRLDLTVKEFDLLYLLASSPGRIFSRKELLQQVWGFSFAGYEHTVTSHINRLRLKIEKNLNQPVYILTAWGSGYRFAE